ncbi:hypothetical protein O7C57_08490 [Providencia sp. 21OH12SH02B-Prov]|uniref:hypothetical protein n=1 Tax=Providencia sp. 21OH12SH02B-Prov TaxID=3015951 RepID=UPI0022B6235D|nr:hypothetical protein O7C57_08490 [Providencia sp. 21OH12SH02B-Prov]
MENNLFAQFAKRQHETNSERLEQLTQEFAHHLSDTLFWIASKKVGSQISFELISGDNSDSPPSLFAYMNSDGSTEYPTTILDDIEHHGRQYTAIRGSYLIALSQKITTTLHILDENNASIVLSHDMQLKLHQIIKSLWTTETEVDPLPTIHAQPTDTQPAAKKRSWLKFFIFSAILIIVCATGYWLYRY